MTIITGGNITADQFNTWFSAGLISPFMINVFDISSLFRYEV